MLPDKDISIGNREQQQGDDLARSKVFHLSYSGEKAVVTSLKEIGREHANDLYV